MRFPSYSSIDEDSAGEARSLEETPSHSSIRTAAPADESAAVSSIDASPGRLGALLERLTPKWLSPRGRGIALLWILVALVSTNWVLVKDSGGGLDALTFSFLRFAVAALAFSPFLPEALGDDSQTLIPAGLELGVWTSLGYLTQAIGLSTTDASRASFLSTFTVLAVPLLAGSRLGDGRKISKWVWGSSVMALVGVSLLEQGGGSPAGIGDIWSIASAVFFGIQIYRTERLSRTLPPKSTFKLMSISLAAVAAVAAGADIVSHPSQALGLLLDPRSGLAAMSDKSVPWQSILWTGLLSTDLALLIELSALSTVSSITASLIYTMEPVMGAGLAFALLGERWGGMAWVGAALIIGSSITAQLAGGDDSAQDA